MSDLLNALQGSTLLYGGNATFVEGLYEQYLEDPSTVEDQWRRYFDQLRQTSNGSLQREVAHLPIQKALLHYTMRSKHSAIPANCLSPEAASKQAAVLRLINYHRVRGHECANLDPLGLQQKVELPDLELRYQGLSSEDEDTLFNTGSLVAEERMTLRDIQRQVKDTYCNTIGIEYMHITDTTKKRWIQKRLEPLHGKPAFSAETKRWLLKLMCAAEGIERYLHKRYVGQKRFSLEGAESLIPLLDELIQRGGSQGIKEIGFGLAHRGRLDILINILGKSPKKLFDEFEGKVGPSDRARAGDVKYHQGFSSDVDTPGGPVHLALAFNPSHLEIINPVVQGSVRARQQRRKDREEKEVFAILIHGDASFAGQGVVMESFSMSEARGFTTGGSLHIVINNQIGFTTSNPLDARSTLHCTEVAKMVQAPIFHVNADDPEAVVLVAQVALDYCQEFHQDVVIDLVCYRRHGHNEADEPAVTQPMMYQKIRNHPTALELYTRRLIEEKLLNRSEAEAMSAAYRSELDQGNIVSRPILKGVENAYGVDWQPFIGTAWDQDVDTGLSPATLEKLSSRLSALPEGFDTHPRVTKIMADRKKMAAGTLPIDWGFAETMAYAGLVNEGYPVRLTGQDSCRGTFFHRHAVLRNQIDGEPYIPLQHIASNQANFVVIDSLLSEEAVLAFEYGYATAEPNALVLWEAQFGDFANGAQVVFDQFISSGEVKWQRLCGLVMLLPHGYEGQGPEHSSARLERYLQLCAGDNIQVCVPSTPAQIFHLLRRQMIRPFRKPLIVLTPKSLLRHKLATSSLEELSSGRFQTVIDESDDIDPQQVETVIICCGKVYYRLLETRRAKELTQRAILRLEQLHPFPEQAMRAALAVYPKAKELVWCQDEPRNQGAWYQIQHHLSQVKTPAQQVRYAGRRPCAAPAVGYMSLHQEQERSLIASALGYGDTTVEPCQN